MSIREKLLATSTVKTHVEAIEGIGEVLFIEPSIPAFNALKKRALKYSSSTVLPAKDGKKNQDVSFEMDAEKSDMAEWNKGLVMMTAWELDQSSMIFTSDKDFNAVFGCAKGAPQKHGKKLFAAFLNGAANVVGDEDEDDEEGKKN